LRPGSPDNAPLVGWSALPGLAVATGHYRNGMLLAPITALGLVSLLAEGSLPVELEPFVPTRFASGAATPARPPATSQRAPLEEGPGVRPAPAGRR
jgi:glycine oxidase